MSCLLCDPYTAQFQGSKAFTCACGKKEASSARERKRAERERRKALGLVRCEVWVKPEHRGQIRKLVAELNKAH